MPRFPYFLDSRRTDGGELVSLTRWPSFMPPPAWNISDANFCQRLSKSQGHSEVERIK
jgi:hypothetical protein